MTGSQENGYGDYCEPLPRKAGTDAIELPLYGFKCCKSGRCIAVQFVVPRRRCERSVMTSVRVAASNVKGIARSLLRSRGVNLRRSVAIVVGRNLLKDISTIESCSQTSHC